jgi:hypothetical protein
LPPFLTDTRSIRFNCPRKERGEGTCGRRMRGGEGRKFEEKKCRKSVIHLDS